MRAGGAEEKHEEDEQGRSEKDKEKMKERMIQEGRRERESSISKRKGKIPKGRDLCVRLIR